MQPDDGNPKTPEELAAWTSQYWSKHGLSLGPWSIHPGTGHVFYGESQVASLTMSEEEAFLAIWRSYPRPYQAAPMDAGMIKQCVHKIRRKMPDHVWLIAGLRQRGYLLCPLASDVDADAIRVD